MSASIRAATPDDLAAVVDLLIHDATARSSSARPLSKVALLLSHHQAVELKR